MTWHIKATDLTVSMTHQRKAGDVEEIKEKAGCCQPALVVP
jgi:hypothetical protein